jgi:muramoyltetrapeptide carboxypeptidase
MKITLETTRDGFVKPAALQSGATIGLVAPSSPSWAEQGIERSVSFFENRGFRVVVASHCRESTGYLAGSDRDRAADLNSFFADPSIDAIFCIRGGYGAMRMVEFLDWNTIRENPKIFVGYSDISVLHTAIARNAGFVTFHGPMPVSDMIPGFDRFSEKSLFSTLDGSLPDTGNPDGFPLGCLPLGDARTGIAEGILCGGNLTLIHAMIGTPYELDTREKILFLEDVDEEPFDVDRMLTHLRLAGKLDGCAGFLLGEWTNCSSRGSYAFSMTVEEVLADIIGRTGKPVITGVRAGHCSPLLTIPFGVRARIDSATRSWALVETPVTARKA